MNRCEKFLKEKESKMTDEEKRMVKENSDKFRKMTNKEHNEWAANRIIEKIKYREWESEYLIKKAIISECESCTWGIGIDVNLYKVQDIVMDELKKCAWKIKKTTVPGSMSEEFVSEKFKEVPLEIDTKVVSQFETKFDGYDVLFQRWYWDGIFAESIIFDSTDVSNLNDDEIKRKIKSSELNRLDSGITFNRSDSGFTFVNFNFEPA